MKRRNRNEHLELLTNVSDELAHLAASTDVRGFLQRTAEHLARHLGTAVCSIYMYEESTALLVLEATIGLKPESVGSVRLQSGEGLVGKAMQQLRPIVVDEASKHPEYRFFPEAGEEAFDCFMAVPILRGVERIGVLVVQRESPRAFSDDETAVVRALASQLAGAVGNARALISIQENTVEVHESVITGSLVKGDGVSPGNALGRAFVFRRQSTLAAVTQEIEGGTSKDLVAEAFADTAKQLSEMQSRLKERLPEAASLIFEAHIMMLQDDGFQGRVFVKMDEGLSDVSAVAAVARQYIDIFASSDHDYMREKAKDVEDLALRIIDQLHKDEGDLSSTFAERIVIAKELLPSDMLRLALENVGGVILAGGGLTSHVAILARSLQIPAAIVHEPALMHIEDGTLLGLNGDAGNVYVNPTEDIQARLSDHLDVEKLIAEDVDRIAAETVTKDGVRVKLMANINLLGELDLAVRLKAEGVGLYRTEFPFLVRDTFPTCEEQEVIYQKLFERMSGREVTIRTIDAGGDKMLSFYDTAGEANPELGLRSTRFALQHPDVFDDQLKAIIRARNPGEPLRIMFPMISSPDEFHAARGRLMDCLASEGLDSKEPVRVGMMLELPAVVDMMDEFVELADFFSVGTNDFVQYMLAADRTNAKVAEYYCPYHPAVLRALKRMVRSAVEAKKDISVCGEMAHDPKYVPFFVGIGVRKLSVDPRWLYTVQSCIQSMTLEEMSSYSEELLAGRSIEEVRGRLRG